MTLRLRRRVLLLSGASVLGLLAADAEAQLRLRNGVISTGPGGTLGTSTGGSPPGPTNWPGAAQLAGNGVLVATPAPKSGTVWTGSAALAGIGLLVATPTPAVGMLAAITLISTPYHTSGTFSAAEASGTTLGTYTDPVGP
jgi:hypothetical protein